MALMRRPLLAGKRARNGLAQGAPPDAPASADEASGRASENGPESGGQSSRILVNASFRALADIGSKIATATLYILVARKAGASQFGVLAFGISFGGIVVTLGQFGQEVVLTREVSRDHSQLERFYSDVLFSKLMLSVPPLLVAVGVAALLGTNLDTSLVVLFMGLGFIGDCVIGVSFAVFLAFERVGFVPVVLVTQRWATTAAAATALFLGQGVVAVAAIYCIGAAMSALFAVWLLYHRIARPRLHFDWRASLRVSREAIPIGLGTIAFLLLSRIDTTMLQLFTNSTEVGQYGAAYRLLETTAFVTWSVNTAVIPTMSRLNPRSNPPVGFVYERAIKLVLSLTVPLAVGAVILASPIVALLYGPEFHRAADAVVLLAPTIMLYPISALSTALIYSQDVRRIVGATYVTVLIENVVWNLIAIPRFSLYGAAVGTSVSELLVSSTLVLLSKRLHGPLGIGRIIAGPVLASAVSAAAMVSFQDTLAIAIPLGITLYFAVLLAFERVRYPDDFAVLAGLADRLRGRSGAVLTMPSE
jgi:O-antigen/teichoic acid export membrane protein